MWEDLSLIVFLTAVFLFARMLIRSMGSLSDLQNGSGGISSGMVGAMAEVDKVVRPSMEHVIKAKEEEATREDAIGGE